MHSRTFVGTIIISLIIIVGIIGCVFIVTQKPVNAKYESSANRIYSDESVTMKIVEFKDEGKIRKVLVTIHPGSVSVILLED